MNKKLLIIIDGNSLVHRAFHALPPLTTKKGEEVGAVYGFLLAFFKALKDFNPDFIAATFDVPSPTFRHQEYNLYKAQRAKTPSELSHQIPKVKEVLLSFGVPVFEKEGYEADDLIGTIASLSVRDDVGFELENIILSGDMDLFQLVDQGTKVYLLNKGVKNAILYDQEKVKERYQGLFPGQLSDFKGLRGDPSDNIPGVPGVGEKTGIKLIKEFGNIENLYNRIEQGEGEIKDRLRNLLLENKETAFLSKKLAQIKCDVPLEFKLEGCSFDKYDKEKIARIFKDLEFNSLLDKLPNPKSWDEH